MVCRKSTRVLGGKGEMIWPVPFLSKRALEIRAFPASLFLRSAPVFGRPCSLVPPGAPGGARGTVAGVGRPGCEWLAALRAASPVVRAQDLPIQLPVCGQDGGAEVPAKHGICEHLRAGTRLIAVVQQQAAAMVAVGAQGADQPLGPA